ncbi:uncharacterized protein STEHIDRAFT_157486 [Stereum hirsutum FP-91666 SS1]|uniref:uncharacterized protein n=1 Tax=Stereum hirsutum (strain FP-91666) TaxID=721885 RepID=UPI000444A150|nr:uncharacterized protein STEHIDRAFT_157486 [Stereum hirsutum FP-91666 SS1]EIM85961.1 hypothetical protein STEHIDRAFT_157486 [Stereum hirsutum FP-91666 SS1]
MCSTLVPPSSDLGRDEVGGEFEVRGSESEYAGKDSGFVSDGLLCDSDGLPEVPASVSTAQSELTCEYAISPWNIGLNAVANKLWYSSSQGPLDVNWGEDSGSPPIASEGSGMTDSTMVDSDVQVSSGCVCPSELMGCDPDVGLKLPALDGLEHGFSQLTSNTSDGEGYDINFDPDDDDDNFNLAESPTTSSSQASRGPTRRGRGNSKGIRKGSRAGKRRIVVNTPCKIACHFCRRRKISCRQTTFPFPKDCE